MSRAIKIADEVYNDLLEMQRPRETISQVIGRLLSTIKPLQEVKDILGPSHYLAERPKPEVKE